MTEEIGWLSGWLASWLAIGLMHCLDAKPRGRNSRTHEALPNLRNRDAAGVVGPHSGVPRAERAATAAGRVRYHYQAISASSHLCWARCGVNFWLRGPRLTASCYWNVPECSTSGSSVEYAMCLVVVVVGLGASLSFGSFFPSSVVD